MRFDVLTLFPELFSSYLTQSLLHRALEQQLVGIEIHNIRDWASGKHKQVDDRPFGGGPGMVLKPEPVVHCVEEIQQLGEAPGHLVMLSPQGRTLSQQVVEELAGHERIVLLCGRYEGFDERVVEILQPDEVSLGDFILNGGEVAAMVVIDAVVRLVPSVLGDESSNQQDSFSGPQRRLEFAQYTRPRDFRGRQVPDVLISGNHNEIARWRAESSLARTQARRHDLLE